MSASGGELHPLVCCSTRLWAEGLDAPDADVVSLRDFLLRCNDGLAHCVLGQVCTCCKFRCYPFPCSNWSSECAARPMQVYLIACDYVRADASSSPLQLQLLRFEQEWRLGPLCPSRNLIDVRVCSYADVNSVVDEVRALLDDPDAVMRHCDQDTGQKHQKQV